jgi:hypothetical protein
MIGWKKQLLIGWVLLGMACAVRPARATDAPPDPCSLLSAAAVSSALGGTYGAPESSVAPRPYANTVQGTDCHYKAKNGGDELLFRVYFDHSATEATGLHAKLKFFYSPATPVAGVGDEAYLDPQHAVHVRKGNVRFYLNASNGDSPATMKGITALAEQVAGKL